MTWQSRWLTRAWCLILAENSIQHCLAEHNLPPPCVTPARLVENLVSERRGVLLFLRLVRLMVYTGPAAYPQSWRVGSGTQRLGTGTASRSVPLQLPLVCYVAWLRTVLRGSGSSADPAVIRAQ